MDTVFRPKILPQDSPAIPLLEKNDRGRGVYISHLDRSPIGKKIFAFAVILLMNTAYAVIMLWRASKNGNVVLALVLNDFHYVETGLSRMMKKGFWSWCWMFMVATFDYHLLGILWPQVRGFITGHLWFRLRYGFRKTEIVFRAPMGKKFREMLALSKMKFQQAFQMSLLKATHRQFTLENTGFCTRHPPWELCYAASMDAYRLADDGAFNSKNWELSVWQKDGHHQWTVWEIWRQQDPFLRAKVIQIMKERLKAEGNDKLAASLEDMQLASVGSAPLSDPTKQELRHYIITLFMEESWTEAISEVDWIRNQLPRLQ